MGSRCPGPGTVLSRPSKAECSGHAACPYLEAEASCHRPEEHLPTEGRVRSRASGGEGRRPPRSEGQGPEPRCSAPRALRVLAPAGGHAWAAAHLGLPAPPVSPWTELSSLSLLPKRVLRVCCVSSPRETGSQQAMCGQPQITWGHLYHFPCFCSKKWALPGQTCGGQHWALPLTRGASARDGP